MILSISCSQKNRVSQLPVKINSRLGFYSSSNISSFHSETCKWEDFVLYFFLCFRSLRDRAPASDAGSGGSSPPGSIFDCKKATVPSFESTLALGSDLAALSIKLRFTRFSQVPRSTNGFLRRVQWLFPENTLPYVISIFLLLFIVRGSGSSG